MKHKPNRKWLEQSCQWLRHHWDVTNLDVPEHLLERWIYEEAEDEATPPGFHLAVFTFGYLQYDVMANHVPHGVERTVSAKTLVTLFTHWQMKLSLAEMSRRTILQTRALPLFSFPEDEQVQFWLEPEASAPQPKPDAPR